MKSWILPREARVEDFSEKYRIERVRFEGGTDRRSGNGRLENGRFDGEGRRLAERNVGVEGWKRERVGSPLFDYVTEWQGMPCATHNPFSLRSPYGRKNRAKKLSPRAHR